MLTFPNAKINLGLNITEKRPDGYHNLETIFYPIPVEDALEINPLREGDGKYCLHQAGMEIAGEAENNLVVKDFVIASVLIYVFSFKLNVLPTFGLDSWKSYILPVIAMGGYSVSYLARLMRSSLLEVMGQDYIRTARAKGLTEFAVVTKHALRNALIPVITVLGPTVAGLLTGSFVVEKIFAIPGIGYYFVNSVTQRDYTTIMGVTIFFAAFLMAMVLLVDIFYCLIDPRIKFDA